MISPIHSLCSFDQSVGDFLIELLRYRSHAFVAILTKESRWAVVFESCSASAVFIEHDPERRIKSCGQFVLCHLRSDKHIAYYILHCLALPGTDLEPITVRRCGEDDKTGVTLDFLQLASDARDLSIMQKSTKSDRKSVV